MLIRVRRHWTICLTPGQWCAECPGVGMLGRSVGKAGRQEKQAGEMSSSVWTGCLSLSLKKTTSILLPQNASVLITCCREQDKVQSHHLSTSGQPKTVGPVGYSYAPKASVPQWGGLKFPESDHTFGVTFFNGCPSKWVGYPKMPIY